MKTGMDASLLLKDYLERKVGYCFGVCIINFDNHIYSGKNHPTQSPSAKRMSNVSESNECHLCSFPLVLGEITTLCHCSFVVHGDCYAFDGDACSKC